MKYVDRLQKMILKLEILKNYISEENSFSGRMKSFLKALRYQKKMKSLRIQLPQKASFVNPILLQSTKYPQSLLNLQLLFNEKQYQGGSDDKVPGFDLSFFKKLDTFALQITDDHFVISRLMDTLPSLSHLQSLAILLPSSFVLPEASPLFGPHYYNLDSQAFSNLAHLSIRVPRECMKITLFERLNLSNLHSFQLSFSLNSAQKYKEALSNLSKMKHLKTLKLSITYFEQLEELTKHLFENIADLELLTSLRIFLVSPTITPNYRQKGKISSDTLPALAKILQKPIKIQYFSLECRELIISHQFDKLMEIFSGASGKNFTKFKLGTVPFELGEGKIELLERFIEGLENVRALKLLCFDLNSDEVLARLTSAIMKLKEIRSISLGRIGGNKVEEQAFIESLARILEKRGLQSVECEFTDEFNKRIGIFYSPLSFEKISKKNPYFKFVSENLWPIVK